MAKQSLGIFKCRVEMRRLVPGGQYSVHIGWEDRNVEVFVDPQALANIYGPKAHDNKSGRAFEAQKAVLVEALKIAEFKS